MRNALSARKKTIFLSRCLLHSALYVMFGQQQQTNKTKTHSACMRQMARKKEALSACTTRRVSSKHVVDPACANNVAKHPNLMLCRKRQAQHGTAHTHTHKYKYAHKAAKRASNGRGGAHCLRNRAERLILQRGRRARVNSLGDFASQQTDRF